MLRILTINTWHGHLPRNAFRIEPIEPAGYKERRTAALCTGIREVDPDVILFQECLPQPGFSRRLAAKLGYDQVSKICNAGLRVFGLGMPIGIEGGEGVAILAKRHLGLCDRGVRRLSGIGFTSPWVAAQLGQLRFALAGEVQVDGRPVLLINTHLRYAYPSLEAFHHAWADLSARGVARGQPGRALLSLVRHNIRMRDAELRRLAHWVQGWVRRGLPVVIGADLNLDHDAAQTLHFVDSLGMRSVLATTSEQPCTWDPEGNPNIAFSIAEHHPDGTPKPLAHRLVAHYDAIPQCPDHLLLGPTFGREVLRDGGLALNRAYDGVFPSDHYGVFAEVRVA